MHMSKTYLPQLVKVNPVHLYFDEISFKGTFCTSVSEEVLEASTSVSVSVPLEPLSDCKALIQKLT